MEDQLVEQLMGELASFGISCDQGRAELMVRHLMLVIEKNKVMNLTRIVDPSEAVTLHLVDSLLPLCCSELRMSEGIRFLDVGTGGGFPGIPLGVMTDAAGLLIDSVGKKVSAVNEFISELGLERLEARQIRVEDLARECLRCFDVVIARAVAQTNVLIEYAAPLLSKDGVLVVEKGQPSSEELSNAERAADICGLRLVSRETFELPREFGHRVVLLYQKFGSSRIKLPRRTGLAKHEPLGVL